MALAAGDPLWYYKVLGLHCDGTNGSTTFTDVKSKTVTANGDVQISTAQYPSLTGKSSSAYFDGSGDYLSLSNTSDFDFGSGDFLVRFRFRPSSLTGNKILIHRGQATNYSPWTLWTIGANLYAEGSLTGSSWAYTLTGATTLSVDTWYVGELYRYGTEVGLRVNGTRDAYTTVSGSLMVSTASPRIGVNSAGTNAYSGYMSEIEIYKGTCVNTADYTPPTDPFPNTYVRVSGTTRDNTGSLASRLVRVYRRDTGAYVGASAADATSGEWVVVAANSGTTAPVKHFAVAHDAPGNPFNGTFLFALRMDDTSLSDETGRTVTIAGNATRSSTQSKFGGYSAYFDGTGDYLSIPAASTIGTGDFTFEAWIYVTTPGSVFFICDNRTSDNDANGFGFYVRSTSKLTFITDGTAYEGTTTVTGGAWHHVSLCRSGTSVRAFLDGNLESTTTKSNNFSRTTWLLGHQWSVSGTLSSGYIDDAFCLSGAAARTESFTPASGKFAYILPSATENAQIYDDITPY